MFCIPKEYSVKIKQAFKEGTLTVEGLYQMKSSQERRTAFAEFSDTGTAKEINSLFEQAMESEQDDALVKWAKKVMIGKQKDQLPAIVKKIKELDTLLTPQTPDTFFEDLIADEMGVSLTEAQAKKIYEMGAELEEMYDPDMKYVDEDGSVPESTIEYLKKRRAIQEYTDSLNPSAQLRILTSTIGRGMMLASIKSPITNIIGNSVQGITEGVIRRTAKARLVGDNNDLAVKFVKDAMKIYNQTGYDITRIMDITETDKILGEQIATTQGKGAVRKIGRVVENIIFKNLMTKPDVVFASTAFADFANIASTKQAKSEGLKGNDRKKRAREIMIDSLQVQPKTEEGQFVREQAISDALYATYQNESWYSRFALGIRNVLNSISGDVRIGDQMMPFVKTPANVIGASIDMTGLGIPIEVARLLNRNTFTEMRKGNLKPIRALVRSSTRAGLGMLIAFLISLWFDDDEFIGAYPTTEKERALLEAKNARENSFKVGDRWVSFDYLGAYAAPLLGIMYAKKYGKKGGLEKLIKYGQGGLIQLSRIPGIDALTNTIKEVKDLSNNIGKATDANEMARAALATILNYAGSRFIPAIVSDVAISTDEYQRKTNKDKPFQAIKAKIPGVRQTLPEKVSVLGTPLKSEPWWSQLLFGARIKTEVDNSLIKELTKLDDKNALPALSRVDKSQSDKVKTMKSQLSPTRFQAFSKFYYRELASNMSDEIKTTAYKVANTDDKTKILNNAKDDALTTALTKYGYKKKK